MPSKRRWALVVAAFIGCGALLVALSRILGEDEPPIALPECQHGPTTPGIDVSYYQNTIEWKRVRKAGVLFAFIRVSDGTGFPDPLFAQNWNGARKVGIMRGVYQYFRPDEDPIAQADLLIAAIKRDPGELPPVLDIETDGDRSPTAIARAITLWIDRIRAKLDLEPIIYTGPDFWRTRVNNADFTSQPLWIAHYIEACPTVPAPWTAWTFWQYSDRGTVPGIDTPVDLDVFAGTFADLEEFARKSRRGTQAARR